MNYDLYDLGEREKGTVIELTLSAKTNIKLIDKMNYDLYQHYSDYRCATKYVEVAPYRMIIPESRHWFLMVEQNKGRIKHSVMIYPPKKAVARDDLIPIEQGAKPKEKLEEPAEEK